MWLNFIFEQKKKIPTHKKVKKIKTLHIQLQFNTKFTSSRNLFDLHSFLCTSKKVLFDL